jgi:predicted CXXCH cytochrome family protein
MPVIHKIVIEKNSCINCHSPHSSSQEKLIKAESIELCLSCHNKSISTAEKKLTNIKQLLKNSKVMHGAIEQEGCSGCHAAHASRYPSLLTAAFPAGEYTSAQPDSFALCFNCHDKALLIDEVVKTETNFRNENQNLHFTHINGDKGRNCNVCHDMHGSQSDHLIAGKVKFGNWEMPMNYNSRENGGSCLTGCHSEKKYDRIQFFNNNPEQSIIVAKIETKAFEEAKTQPEKIILIADTVEINSNNEYWKILEEFNKIITPKIKFEFKTTIIISGTEKELINVIDFMRRYPAGKLEIDGHTDGAGENDYSISLSLMRAEKVKKMMVNFGISKERITTKGFGSTMPVASNKSEKTRAENRRVELKLIK